MVRSVEDFDTMDLVFCLGIVLCFVLFMSPAFADEPTEDIPPVENVEEVVENVPVEEPAVPDSQPVQPDNQPVEVVPVQEVEEPYTLYDSDGVVVMSSEPPDVPLMAPSSTSPYSSVTGGTYTSIAEQIAPKLSWSDDYVFYRASQYVYRLAYGDLTLNGQTFTGSDLNFIDFTYSSNTTGYLMSRSTGTLNLNCNDAIVYSNLGDYPILNVEGAQLNMLCWFAVVTCGVYVMHCLYSFLLRLGVRNVQE